jgi:hypothetical protein
MTPLAAPEATRPPPRPTRSLGRRAFAALSSPQLAIALLISVLVCCVIGVTVIKGERAGVLIFNAPWFNGLLVLLAVSSGLTFFVRIWGRKLTLISVGMIVFHVCFLSMLGGVVYNSLFHFNGVMRLTEGETLPNRDPASFDLAETGRFFDYARLRGETTLVRMHRGYKVDGQDKRAAYEIRVGEGAGKTTDTIYMTQNLDHDGMRYLVSKEGYSIGVILHDKQGKELNATMVPLQSLPTGKETYLYTTGTAQEPASFIFPPAPAPPALLLEVRYVPDPKLDRSGQVEFFTRPVSEAGAGGELAVAGQQGPVPAGHGAGAAAVSPVRSGKVAIGQSFDAGDYLLQAGEIRYWVGINVRHDPGLTTILASLWAGLGGMTMTFVGRILQDAKRGKRGASDQKRDAAASGEHS